MFLPKFVKKSHFYVYKNQMPPGAEGIFFDFLGTLKTAWKKLVQILKTALKHLVQFLRANFFPRHFSPVQIPPPL